MQKIIPHLWFDRQAEDAAKFYTGVFENGKIGHTSRYGKEGFEIHGMPEGTVLTVDFEIAGYSFVALNGGPHFKLNPSISFFLNFDPSKNAQAKEHLDTLWKKLSEGGKIFMPLQEYPFSKHYGWVEDMFGVSWQLILTNPEGEPRPFIVPSLLFTGPVVGKAEEAIEFYTSVFKNAKRGMIARYPAGMEPDKEGTLMFGDCMLEGQWFAAMDSGHEHGFGFNEALSFMVMCDSQDEIDYYWEKLSAVPQAEQCGWVKDRFGVSWQIVPRSVGEMLKKGTKEQTERLMKALLQMKKLDMDALASAFNG